MPSPVHSSTIISFNCSTIVQCSSLKYPSVSRILSSASFISSSTIPTSVSVSASTAPFCSLQRLPWDSSSTCFFIASNSSSDNEPFYLIALPWSHIRCSVDSNIPLSLHSLNILRPYFYRGIVSRKTATQS